jgi:hypothetical protein
MADLDSLGGVSGYKGAGAKAGAKQYDLATNAGKISYLTDENAAMKNLLNTKYLQYQGRPNYSKFLDLANALIERNNRDIKNPETAFMRGGDEEGKKTVLPEDLAKMELKACADADTVRLMTVKERFDDDDREIEEKRGQKPNVTNKSGTTDPYEELRSRMNQEMDEHKIDEMK